MLKEIYNEIGFAKMAKYLLYSFAMLAFKLMIISPLRVFFLKIFGAKTGTNCVLHKIIFFNLYRGGFSNIRMGNKCFVGDETMLDMADTITLEDHVTLAERVVILTHMNVGYADHPLQKYFPKFTKPVILKRGVFVGCNSTILPGVTIGESSLVAAGSVVTKDVPPFSVVGGVPAKIIKKIDHGNKQ